MNSGRAICLISVFSLLGYGSAFAQTQPAQPVNVSPCGATGVSLTPTLQASAFSDPNGDSHMSSTWQVNTTPDFDSPPYYVWDSGETGSNKTSISVPSGYLTACTTYYWRVIYRDDTSEWSAWSAPCSFMTLGESEHTADQNGDGLIELTELLRVIQFYNSAGFHCADDPGSTEDGYVPGPGANHTCVPHASDYAPSGPDWQILLTELLRLIQFYNSGGYHACLGEGTEDGYCPGLA